MFYCNHLDGKNNRTIKKIYNARVYKLNITGVILWQLLLILEFLLLKVSGCFFDRIDS